MFVEESVLWTSTSGASAVTFTVSANLGDLQRHRQLCRLADAEHDALLR